jgi:hypothetical protein
MKAILTVGNPSPGIFSDGEVSRIKCKSSKGPGRNDRTRYRGLFSSPIEDPMKKIEPAGNTTDRNPVELRGAYFCPETDMK